MEVKKGLPDRNGVKVGYKQTEVGVIPEDWNVIPIGKIFEFKNGLNKAKGYFGKGTPIVNYMDVFNNPGLFKQDVDGKVTLTVDEIRNYQVKKGDVFFTRTSETVDEIGMSSVLLENITDAVFSGFVLRGRPKNDILDLLYKQYCFRSKEVRKQICSTSSYTTRALTNGKLLSNVYIAVPPTKAEQTAITATLSDADALIQSMEKLIAKKRLIKQGAMEELLKPKEGWVMKKLGEVLFLQGGFAFKSEKFKESGLPIVRISNINDGYIDFETVVYYGNDEKIPNEFIINKADTLIAMSGATTGKVGVFNQSTAAYQNQRVGRFDLLDPIKTDKAFIHQLVCSTQFKRALTKELEQGAQPNISAKQIESLEFIVPIDKEEQASIATILSDMDAEIAALETKFSKYKQVKQGMMQNLLTGKIRLV